MSNKILAYVAGGRQVELRREDCHLFSRSQMLTGQTCPAKRMFAYHWQGRGVESTVPNDDLVLGKAVHLGLEKLLLADQTMSDAAAQAAYEAVMGELSEDFGLIREELANLAYALVWIFQRRRLPGLLERFEVVEVEPEICWLVGESGRAATTNLVMMSRPDAVLRSREDGRLWTASWKTAKRFDGGYLERFKNDVQALTEGLAIQAKYGQAPAGTLYTYLLKGDRLYDADLGIKRYASPLIRPYCDDSGLGYPEYRCAYKWIDAQGVEKRCGKGWYRINTWEFSTMAEWLEALDAGVIQPEAGRDWLGEAVIEPDTQPFREAAAKRWQQKAIQQEEDWIEILAGRRIAGENEGSCYDFASKCTFFGVCWEHETIEGQIVSGQKQLRQESNHPVEFPGEEV